MCRWLHFSFSLSQKRLSMENKSWVFLKGKRKCRGLDHPNTSLALMFSPETLASEGNITDMLAGCSVSQQDVPEPLFKPLVGQTVIRLTHEIWQIHRVWHRLTHLPSSAVRVLKNKIPHQL